MTVDSWVATLAVSPRVTSGAHRDAVRMSHGCREENHGYGGVCRIWVAWRATGGGCEDRNCKSGAYGILTETQLSARSPVLVRIYNYMKNHKNDKNLEARFRIGVDVGGTLTKTIRTVHRVTRIPTFSAYRGWQERPALRRHRRRPAAAQGHRQHRRAPRPPASVGAPDSRRPRAKPVARLLRDGARRRGARTAA